MFLVSFHPEREAPRVATNLMLQEGRDVRRFHPEREAPRVATGFAIADSMFSNLFPSRTGSPKGRDALLLLSFREIVTAVSIPNGKPQGSRHSFDASRAARI